MRKSYHIILLLSAMFLAGCLPQSQVTPTVTPTATTYPAPTAVVTIPSLQAIQPESGCTVISQQPTPGPTAESIFPPVADTDWIRGPANASVTIIEYSDFQ